MIVMIDNYDSFTYNIVQYLGELGAEVTVHRNDMIGTWITEDLVETKDETTPFTILYNSFTNWYTENYTNGKVDQINVKKRLIEWQNTNYGFTDGINGNLRYPKFNLKPMEEEE